MSEAVEDMLPGPTYDCSGLGCGHQPCICDGAPPLVGPTVGGQQDSIAGCAEGIDPKVVEMVAQRYAEQEGGLCGDWLIEARDAVRFVSPVLGELHKAKLAQARNALNDAKLQIEYLHEKFQATGSGATVLARIDAALAEIDGAKP